MQFELKLTDEEAAALFREHLIEHDDDPLSPRIRALRRSAQNSVAHQTRRQFERRDLADYVAK
jgi:hypothetical protein